MLAIRGRTIRSCQNGMSRMTRDIPRAVRLLEAGQIDAAPLITGRYALEDINAAAAAARERRDLTGVVVP
jgi:Zn-dependent alcohol dehydrogenase